MRGRWSLASHDIVWTIWKFVSLLKLENLAVTTQKDLKLMYFVHSVLLNISTRGLRKLNYSDQEISRILFGVLDVSNIFKFESHTAPNYLCWNEKWQDSAMTNQMRPKLMMSWVGRATVQIRTFRRQFGNWEPINRAADDTPLDVWTVVIETFN